MLWQATTLLAALAAFASAKDQRTFAVLRFYGKGPLTTGRMDPIVNPGVASGHVHMVQGGSNFALTMADTTALSSTCTSARIKNDKSNYWVPQLYFQDPVTHIFSSVPMFYMNVYYFFEATDDPITAFEPGYRMVVGKSTLRTPPSTGGKLNLDTANGPPQPVQWTCPRTDTSQPLYPPTSDGLSGVGIGDPINKGAGTGFPDQNCDGYASPLRSDIHFPSCYNPAAGKDNFMQNSQFPSSAGATAGKMNCPPGWIHTPHMFYEVYWNTPLFASRWTPGQGNQPFVLANGDPTGYSLHADFLSGWDVPTLQQMIDNCNAGDSGMDKCPGLIGGINDPSTRCNIPSAIAETVLGDMAALPGNNPVTPWGKNLPAPSPPGTSSAPPSAYTAPAPAPLAYVASPPPAGSSPLASPPVSIASSPITSAATPPTTQPAGRHGSTLTIRTTTYVYENMPQPTPTAPTTASQGNVSPVTGWSYAGCFSDFRDSRVLSADTFISIGDHQVTMEKCIVNCAAAGYSIAGTEFGGQCFCGNTLASASTKLNETRCDMPCEGDATQTCGGSLALSVYKLGGKRRMGRHLARHVNRFGSA